MDDLTVNDVNNGTQMSNNEAFFAYFSKNTEGDNDE
jgi:hypothetical protein